MTWKYPSFIVTVIALGILGLVLPATGCSGDEQQPMGDAAETGATIWPYTGIFPDCNPDGGCIIPSGGIMASSLATGAVASDQSADEDASALDASDENAQCFQFSPTGENCGTCDLSVEEYCSHYDCSLPSAPMCGIDFVIDTTLEQGCGFIRLTQRGDVGDRWGQVWNQATEEVVYVWHNGKLSTGCAPDTHGGDMPECSTWTEACTLFAGDADAGL